MGRELIELESAPAGNVIGKASVVYILLITKLYWNHNICIQIYFLLPFELLIIIFRDDFFNSYPLEVIDYLDI